MPNTNGRGTKRAILYARVSTDEQARSGYSLAQQMEALREYAAREGYEVLEEVIDPGQSGASLERPGMDRVRELVAEGGVSVVLAQDRDRFSREPAYHYLLGRVFEEHGCRLRALNDRGDDSPEGVLTDGILDQLAKFERAKITERSRRGKLQKARQGKLIAERTPNYGFRFNETRDGYVVDEEAMTVVGRIFRMVGVDGVSVYGVVQNLEHQGVPAPGGGRWNKTHIRHMLLSDLYKPHTFEEASELVAPEVAATLNPEKEYGIWWFNRRRVTVEHVTEAGPEGRSYRRVQKTVEKPKEEWIAVPVPGSGISLKLVEIARDAIKDNRPISSAGNRFWELSGKIIRCAVCGSVMQQQTTTRQNGKKHFYYWCRQRYNNGPRDCTNRKNYRASEIEEQVWRFISGLLKDPGRLRVGLEQMIKQECEGLQGNPDQEAKMWANKLRDADRKRSRLQDMAAEGYITFDELGEKLWQLDETRKIAERELATLSQRQEKIKELESDRDTLLESFARLLPEALDALTPEQRHRVYKILQLQVVLYPEALPQVSGIFGENIRVCDLETVSRPS